MANIANEDTFKALSSTMDMLKHEYDEFKLTKSMRRKLAKELGEDQEIVDTWQSIVDVLDHVDITELAKKHPDAIGKVSKVIIFIISIFYPQVKVANVVPQEFAAKLVEIAGFLTPEHIVNIIAKKQVEKNKEKRKLLEKQESTILLETTENTDNCADDLSTVVNVSAEDSKKATPKLDKKNKKKSDIIPAFFSRRKDTPPSQSNEDILDTIKRLSDLKDSGVISQEEFDAKKTELLAKL